MFLAHLRGPFHHERTGTPTVMSPLPRRLTGTALLLVAAACSDGARDRPPAPDSAAAAPDRPGTGLVFTADEGSNSLSRIDLGSGRVTQIALAIEPHNVQVSPDGRWLRAVGSVVTREASAEHAPEGGRQHGELSDARGRLVILATDSLAAGGRARSRSGCTPPT